MTRKYRYVEDFEMGQAGVTRPRTIGEPDITNFACITQLATHLSIKRSIRQDDPGFLAFLYHISRVVFSQHSQYRAFACKCSITRKYSIFYVKFIDVFIFL